MPGNRCIVSSCPNSSGNNSSVSLHRFPGDAGQRALWARLLRLPERLVTDNSRLCSLHFSAEDLRSRRKSEDILPIPVRDFCSLHAFTNLDKLLRISEDDLGVPAFVILRVSLLIEMLNILD